MDECNRCTLFGYGNRKPPHQFHIQNGYLSETMVAARRKYFIILMSVVVVGNTKCADGGGLLLLLCNYAFLFRQFVR